MGGQNDANQGGILHGRYADQEIMSRCVNDFALFSVLVMVSVVGSIVSVKYFALGKNQLNHKEYGR